MYRCVAVRAEDVDASQRGLGCLRSLANWLDMMADEEIAFQPPVSHFEVERTNRTLAVGVFFLGLDQRTIAETERSLGKVVPAFHRRKLHFD